MPDLRFECVLILAVLAARLLDGDWVLPAWWPCWMIFNGWLFGLLGTERKVPA
jgi:hypothetical protein